MRLGSHNDPILSITGLIFGEIKSASNPDSARSQFPRLSSWLIQGRPHCKLASGNLYERPVDRAKSKIELGDLIFHLFAEINGQVRPPCGPSARRELQRCN